MRVATAELFESQEPLLDTLSKKRRRRRRAPAAVDLAGGRDAPPARSSGEASSRRGRAQMQRRDDAPLTTMGRARRLRFAGAAPLHGWVPDVAQFCHGLPGALAPMGDFDPLKLSKQTISTVRRYREAEVMHGRVAMVAFVGFLVGEHGAHQVLDVEPSLTHDALLLKTPGLLLGALAMQRRRLRGSPRGARLGDAESRRAGLGEMRDSYYPGDIGYRSAPDWRRRTSGFATMATRELQHGRLAMIAHRASSRRSTRRTETSRSLFVKLAMVCSIPGVKRSFHPPVTRRRASPCGQVPGPGLVGSSSRKPGFILGRRARGLRFDNNSLGQTRVLCGDC